MLILIATASDNSSSKHSGCKHCCCVAGPGMEQGKQARFPQQWGSHPGPCTRQTGVPLLTYIPGRPLDWFPVSSVSHFLWQVIPSSTPQGSIKNCLGPGLRFNLIQLFWAGPQSWYFFFLKFLMNLLYIRMGKDCFSGTSNQGSIRIACALWRSLECCAGFRDGISEECLRRQLQLESREE